MDAHMEIRRVVLAPWETMVLDQAIGVEVIARKGCVWLTQDGDSRDIVLNPGQSFTLSQASGVVMTTSRGADFILRAALATATTAGEEGWMKRLVAWFAPRSSRRGCDALDGRIRVQRLA